MSRFESGSVHVPPYPGSMRPLSTLLAKVSVPTLIAVVAYCYVGGAALFGVMAGMAFSDGLPDLALVFIYMAVIIGALGAFIFERRGRKVS